GYRDCAGRLRANGDAVQQPGGQHPGDLAGAVSGRAAAAVRRTVHHVVAVRHGELGGRVLARGPKPRKLVLLRGRLVRLRRLLADGRRRRLLGDLLLLRRRLCLRLGLCLSRDLWVGLLLLGADESVLAGPAVFGHSARSGSSKRRSWWGSLCASLSRLARR